MVTAILEHRSIRKYKDLPVSREVLESILNAGIRASTTGNMQAYSIVVTEDSKIKEKLWEAHFRQNMVLQASVHLTFCADFNRFSKWCNNREAFPGFDNFLSFFSGAIDALLVSQNICIAAEDLGLGVCYLGTATYNADKLVDILNLPKLVVPVACLVIGYPDETMPLTDRLPLKGILHDEVYSDYSVKEIDDIYAEKELSEFTKELLQINDKKTLAQIFTDKRYTKGDNVFFSKKYLEVIKMQGFMNNE
jgi:nitroreductase